MSFKKDMNDAKRDFTAFLPEITKHIKGELVSLESMPGILPKLFDMKSGVDAIQIVGDNLRTVALRVQWNVDYKTFTIRHSRKNGTKTEYEKRNTAIFGDKGYIYPYLTIQAYMDNREAAKKLLSCGVVKTADLYNHVNSSYDYYFKKIRFAPDGNGFISVPFKTLSDQKIQIIVMQNLYLEDLLEK